MTPAEASPDDAGEAEELGHHVPQVGHPDEGQRFHNWNMPGLSGWITSRKKKHFYIWNWSLEPTANDIDSSKPDQLTTIPGVLATEHSGCIITKQYQVQTSALPIFLQWKCWAQRQ